MDKLVAILEWFKVNWVALVAALWLVEQSLRTISELTPWKWDDNIVKVITKIFKSVLPEKK